MKKISKYHWGIVVLHYKAVDVTIQCVDALADICGQETGIVVVDNGSCDHTDKKLSDRYGGRDNIHIIVSEKNLGFARGNNLGYMYLKGQGCDFIALLNNDVFIRQEEFFDRIEKEYQGSMFDILGPCILNGRRQITGTYPQRAVHLTVKSTYLGQIMCVAKWLLSFFGLDVMLGKYISEHQGAAAMLDPLQRYEDVQISGCCIVFSKGYIQSFDGLNPGSFLYLEEEILLAGARRHHLKIVYTPEARAVHIGEAATDREMKGKAAAKRRFRYRNQFKSFPVLRRELAGTDRK